MGPIMRRAGYIFLRRDIRENATYRFVLREYLAYLIERRFNLSWFPEGTRSRTGKLLPPKLGLLTYVVDAYRQGRIDDIMLVPVALVYDQVYETKDFAKEAKGAKKKPENLGWMLRYLRSLRTPYGKAYLRVAEPLSMREALGALHGIDPMRIVMGTGSDELLNLAAQGYAGHRPEGQQIHELPTAHPGDITIGIHGDLSHRQRAGAAGVTWRPH